MKSILAVVLAAVLIHAVFLPATTAMAASETNTPKEEVVYVSLNADGSVREINVVNIFDLDKSGRIIDYGRYTSVRNMTTTDEILCSDGEIRIDAGAGKLYYEGKLDSSVMPWNISIRYYIDGVEYAANEIAGKSGSLKMTVSITENTECRGNFFDGYALQASLKLDGERFRNIVSDGATVANVGADRQLTYIILPGKGAELVITADVTDFETDGFSINGIPLNFSIDIDDAELTSDISRLVDAIARIDNGAGELYESISGLESGAGGALSDGAEGLRGGADQLYAGSASLLCGGEALVSGAGELCDGASELDSGIRTLNAGIAEIDRALDALEASSPALVSGSSGIMDALTKINAALDGVSVNADDLARLTEASSSIKTGIDSLAAGASALRSAISYDAYRTMMLGQGLDVDQLKSNNAAAITGLNTTISGLTSQIASMKAAGLDTTALEAQVAQLGDVAALLAANNANMNGTEAYLTTLGSNMDAIIAGAVSLQNDYREFDAAIGELVDTLTGLTYQVSVLSAAVNTLVAEYEKLDVGISEYTEAVAAIAAGYKAVAEGTERLAASSGMLALGAKGLYGGVSDVVTGIAEVHNGTGALRDGADKLESGVSELIGGISKVSDGAGALKDGTSSMRKETAGIDEQVTDKIDDIIGSFTGEGSEITSFVSEDNTEILAVQFAIKTDAIHSQMTAEIPEPETETLNFWQKLLRLFGLY